MFNSSCHSQRPLAPLREPHFSLWCLTFLRHLNISVQNENFLASQGGVGTATLVTRARRLLSGVTVEGVVRGSAVLESHADKKTHASAKLTEEGRVGMSLSAKERVFVE